jgi:hypothetical protein
MKVAPGTATQLQNIDRMWKAVTNSPNAVSQPDVILGGHLDLVIQPVLTGYLPVIRFYRLLKL